MEEIKENLEAVTQSYLTFMLDKEHFCLAVSSVVKILEMTDITKVPESPAYMKGIINLRGNILPVIDTRIKLGMEPAEYNLKTRILVVDIQTPMKVLTIGAIVDMAKEVISIVLDDIMPPPSLDDYERADYIEGIINHQEKFVMIVDVNKLFAKSELDVLEGTSEV